MIELGKAQYERAELYTFSEAAEEMQIRIGKKVLGRNKILEILRDCNVLNYRNRPFPEFQKYFEIKVKIHRPNKMLRKDVVPLIKGTHGLQFIKKTVEDYLSRNNIPNLKRREKIKRCTPL